VDFATVSGFITRPREGKDSFHAELHGGNLEVAAKVKRPIPQSDGLTKPASLKYNKFPSFIFSSFIFDIYQSFREIFPPQTIQFLFRPCRETNFPILCKMDG
jgi:hypothetical protein